MPRSIPFLLALFLFPYFISAQTGTVAGTVKDAGTGEPLSGATIFIVGTYSGTFTDAAGKFEIKDIKPGDYTIRFAFIGYAEKLYNGVRISPGQTQRLEVEMNSSIQTLGEVEIVGERTLIDLESGKSETKISDEDIAQMSVQNVQDIVSMQVG